MIMEVTKNGVVILFAGRNVTRGYTEKYATEIENKVRDEHNEPQRLFYYYYGNQFAGACTIVPKKNGN